MNGIPLSAETIRKVNNLNELNNLILKLGYRAKPQSLHIPSLDLPESSQKIIKELQLISDYEQKFQIYFGKTTSMRRTDFRNILEPFYRRYPQINSLFVFTENWDEIAFVSPERVAVEPKKVKLLLRILLVDPQNVYHTDIEVLNSISILPVEQKPEIIWQKHTEGFNVERVTREFFEAYRFALGHIKENILLPQNKASYRETHSFAQQLLSRIMFLYYVQKKGWLKWRDYIQDKRYIRNLWVKYKQSNPKKDTFYSLWLSSLFFHAFNKKHQYLTLNIPDEIKESFNLMPFLNGGLFTENELDEIGFKIPDEIFKLLFESDPIDGKKGFLERYNFTIREDTPLEVEVAVDPEMLGKVYESLISEEERGKGGIFYTPRIEIDYMCRLSLVEYLSEETKISKTDLIPLVFEPQRILDNPVLKTEDLRKINDAINRVKIVDPAVGSASFLVGMMNVLIEIMRNLSSKIDKREENLFALKNKVLSENLYGVDVKDWAVMVGELRLWLSLIIETEEKFMDIYTKPLLPNLTFKMRQGDSLVEEIAGVQIPLRGKFVYIPKGIKDKITMLVDRKVEYFRGGRSADLREKDEIERLENEVLKEIVSNEIKRLEDEENKLQKQIAAPKPEQFEMFKIKPEQKDLFEDQIKRLKKRIEEIRPEKERFSNLLKEIGEKTKKDYFLWEIDFAEIFAEKGGFDIVISNPPYVRQEMVAFPLEREEDFGDKEEWRERKRLYKDRLAQSVKIHWGEFIKIDKKSDLYVYFYYHGLALLRPGGVFCFINSNSWLDVGYGSGLQEFLLKNMEPIYIIDNLAKRTFAESDVNTVIVLIKRSPDGPKEGLLKFVAFKKTFEEVIKPETSLEIENTKVRTINDNFRISPKDRKELLIEGIEFPEEEQQADLLKKDPFHMPYSGNKWGGKYLRAPDIYWVILEKGKGKLVRLEDIGKVRFGIKTGANEFFYLDDERILYWQIETSFLQPVIVSPRECQSIIVEPSKLKYKAFVCHTPKTKLMGTRALKYVEWGEAQSFHRRASCKNRNLWYDLGIRTPAKVLWPMIHNDRPGVYLNEKGVLVDHNLFEIVTNSNLEIWASLFWTGQVIFRELYGRANLGQGALKTEGEDIKRLMVINPDKASPEHLKIIKQCIASISQRTVESVSVEVGMHKEQSVPHPIADRAILDNVIFDIIGLTHSERKEVYWAAYELVAKRLVKAGSLKTKGARYASVE
jgi:hypothetical protein